jgi:DNA repair protein RadA/Sms
MTTRGTDGAVVARVKTCLLLHGLRQRDAALAGPVSGVRRVEHAGGGADAAPGPRPARRAGRSAGRGGARALADVTGAESERWSTGMRELDFVLGGGIVPGSIVLVGGEPGIGKSTLLLQAAARLHEAGRATLYVSGEESAAQVRLRADRLQRAAGAVTFLGETRLEAILDARRARPARRRSSSTPSRPSTATTRGRRRQRDAGPRVRRAAAALAKESGTAVFLVGHVTKGGTVAGPKTLEHIVDTVLYFEETGTLDHRVLRSTKNRFGAADEIGVFRMTAAGSSRWRTRRSCSCATARTA